MKLNIGCGNLKKEGYIGVDIDQTPVVDIICSTLELDSKFSDIEAIYARHTLEHLGFEDFDKALRVIYNTLKTGGEFNIIVPDLEYHLKQILDNKNLFKESGVGNQIDNYTHAICSIYGWQCHKNDFHYNGFTEYILKSKLKQAGFINIQRQDDKAWNLNIVCYK